MSHSNDTNHPFTPDNDQPVLVAIDFSEDSRAALIWACNYAESTGAKLIVLHVVHDLASHPGFYHPENTEPLKPMQEVAETMMSGFLDQLKNEHSELRPLQTAEVQLIPGLPPTRIIEVADLQKASLIAIGGRGMASPPHKRLGSVVQRVIKLSAIPVIVVKSEKHGKLKKKEKEKKRNKKDREKR